MYRAIALLILALTVLLLAGCAASAAPPATPIPPVVIPSSAPDGPLGGFHGVLVQRTSHFETSNSNDSIPDFYRQVYDTDRAWSPEQPDRIVIPDAWDGKPVIFTVHASWAGHAGRWVELKLYCGASRPIGNEQEHRLVGVVQEVPNPDSPFLELTTPPLPMEAGTECMVAFKTPAERLLISYQGITPSFGAYVVD